MKRRIGTLLFSAAVLIGQAGSVWAGDLSVAEIRHELATATPEQPADFSGHDLSNLDLSGLDLSGTNLAGADLSNARLAHTNLSGANLVHATLDGAWLIGADFSNANLSHVHMFGPVVANGLKTSRGASPIFKNARLDDARVIARLSNGDDAGADFSNAKLAADMGNQSMGLMRFEAEGADLEGADFSGAELGHALFRFANLKHADFTDADIRSAEFDGADLSGAHFAGARARDASFADANLAHAQGVKQAHHMDLSQARNVD